MPDFGSMNFLDVQVSDYMRRLCDRYDHPVLNEMEEMAEKEGFPIVGRTVGAALLAFATSVGAKRVMELGSGFGYSAYWFAQAVGSGGEVILTDGDPENQKKAEDYLTRLGVFDRCTFLVGDALGSFAEQKGEFDVIYCDIDKHEYPQAFEAARTRLRKGGLYMCDNVLWSGRVAKQDDDELTNAIRKHNEAVYAAEDFLPVIVPIRDGVVVAVKR